MSNSINTKLFDRAHECMEDLTSHPSGIDRSIQAAYDSGDLQELERLVNIAEGILSQAEFEENDII